MQYASVEQRYSAQALKPGVEVQSQQELDYKNVHQIDTSNSRSDEGSGIEIVQWNAERNAAKEQESQRISLEQAITGEKYQKSGENVSIDNLWKILQNKQQEGEDDTEQPVLPMHQIHAQRESRNSAKKPSVERQQRYA